MVEQKRYRLQVRGKLILFVSVLVFSTIFLLTGIFYVSLNRAYQNWIDSSYQSLIQISKQWWKVLSAS